MPITDKTKTRNPLHQYSSYSYRHILIVADSTEVAEEIDTDSTYYQITNGDITREDTVEKRKGNFVVLINGFIDADLVIENLQTQSIITPSIPGKTAAPSSFAIEGEMSILEPRGTHMFSTLQEIYGRLGTGPSGCCFILKTFFIGHLGDGSPDEYITNIKPIMFTPYDITAEFSHTGAEYAMRFFPMQNGASKLPTFARKETTSLKASTIGEAFDKLQKKLNKQSEDYYEKVTEAGFEGRKFRYEFAVDDAYRDYPLNNVKHSAVSSWGSSADFSFGKDAVPEQIIESIMKASRRVMAEAQGKVEVLEEIEGLYKEGAYGKYIELHDVDKEKKLEEQLYSTTPGSNESPKFIFKITSTIVSSKDECTLFFRVNRMELPTGTKEQVFSGNILEKYGDQVLEFDYIFSGNNTDIIEFNMKMNMGMHFLQSLYPAPTLPTIEEYDSKCLSQKYKQAVQNHNQLSNKPLDKQILMPPLRSRANSVTHAKESQETLDYYALMNKWAGLEMANGQMRIIGNPILYNDLNLIPSEIQTGQINSLKSNGDYPSIFPRWTSVPGLLKVNIFTPNPYYGTDNLYEETDEPYVQFWYRGYYFVHKVNNIFSEGTFEQELYFAPLPVESDLPVSDEDEDSDEEKCVKVGKNQGTRVRVEEFDEFTGGA